jgi:signal recognition particle subunit SRP54
MLDTAGRVTIDEELMNERRRSATPPSRTRRCWSPMRSPARTRSTLARAFDERVGITGIVLTRIDGDGRGGAALSMRAVTGKPIKLIGTGEKIDALEAFHPDRIADRILGMGDIVALVEKAAERSTPPRRAQDGRAMQKGSSTSTTSPSSSSRCRRWAAWAGHGHDARHGQDQEADRGRRRDLDDKVLKRQVAIIDSMTKKERRNPDCSGQRARSASPRARAPRCRRSTSCSRCTARWPT